MIDILNIVKLPSGECHITGLVVNYGISNTIVLEIP